MNGLSTLTGDQGLLVGMGLLLVVEELFKRNPPPPLLLEPSVTSCCFSLIWFMLGFAVAPWAWKGFAVAEELFPALDKRLVPLVELAETAAKGFCCCSAGLLIRFINDMGFKGTRLSRLTKFRFSPRKCKGSFVRLVAAVAAADEADEEEVKSISPFPYNSSPEDNSVRLEITSNSSSMELLGNCWSLLPPTDQGSSMMMGFGDAHGSATAQKHLN
jgi:hypothetical protein